MALIKGRRLNVGVHTLTKGYDLKYSGVDFSGALMIGRAVLLLPPPPPLFLCPILVLCVLSYNNILLYTTNCLCSFTRWYSYRRSSTPVFDCIKEFHDSLPVMIQVQYQQHQNNNCCHIQVKVFKCIKHQCQIKEEEYNGNIFRIQFAILVPMKKRINKDCSDKLNKLDEKWNYRYKTKPECRKYRP